MILTDDLRQATPVSDDGWTPSTFGTTATTSGVTLATLPKDLASSCRCYDASPAMVAEAAKTLTASQVDDALLDGWFVETKNQPLDYAIGWSQAADRIARVDRDWENIDDLSDDELPPNVADLRDWAKLELRKHRRLLQWHTLTRQPWPEHLQSALVQWLAKYDACRMACLLIDNESEISTREVARVLRQNPTVPVMRLAIRLRRTAKWRPWR